MPEAASVSSTQPVETPVVVAPAPAVAEPEPDPEPEPESEPELIVSPTYVSTLVATIVPDVTLLAPVIEPGGTELLRMTRRRRGESRTRPISGVR